MKEPDYAMKIMSTGGALIADENCKKVAMKWTDPGGATMQANFQYMKPVDYHFHYHHIVDDHDNLCQSSPALEETWLTQCWEICVFVFLLASKVNSYLVM